MLAIIVAVAHDHVIGKDNQLIWHLPNDLKYFKERTMYHVIIMGRRTFESLPKLLPNRTHWVITKQTDYDVPSGVRVFHSVEEAMAAARTLDMAFVIGGAQIYEATMPYVDRLYVTEVDYDFAGDAFFPAIDTDIWQETERIVGTVDEKNRYPHSFVTYERKD